MGLIDRYFSASQTLHLLLINIHAKYVITHLREADARNKPHIANPDDRNPHVPSLTCLLF
jgi:hypothetical protein